MAVPYSSDQFDIPGEGSSLLENILFGLQFMPFGLSAALPRGAQVVAGAASRGAGGSLARNLANAENVVSRLVSSGLSRTSLRVRSALRDVETARKALQAATGSQQGLGLAALPFAAQPPQPTQPLPVSQFGPQITPAGISQYQASERNRMNPANVEPGARLAQSLGMGGDFFPKQPGQSIYRASETGRRFLPMGVGITPTAPTPRQNVSQVKLNRARIKTTRPRSTSSRRQ